MSNPSSNQALVEVSPIEKIDPVDMDPTEKGGNVHLSKGIGDVQINKNVIIYIIFTFIAALMIVFSLLPGRTTVAESDSPNTQFGILNLDRELENAQRQEGETENSENTANNAPASSDGSIITISSTESPPGDPKIENPGSDIETLDDPFTTVEIPPIPETPAPETPPPAARREPVARNNPPQASPPPAAPTTVATYDEEAARSSMIIAAQTSARLTEEEYNASLFNPVGQLASQNPGTGSGSASGSQGSQTTADAYRQANSQSEKQQFANSSIPEVESRLSSYSLAPGTVMPAIMITALNTDLPGYIIAQVSENIFDYTTGENLLIPAGSRLIAEYNSVVTFGQRRVQIAWDRLIRPDGIVVNLSRAPGVDPQGTSGLRGQVDEHILETLGGVTLSALTSFITGLGEAAINNLLDEGALSSTSDEVVGRLGDVGIRIAERWLNVQPTITITAGSRINVLVVDPIHLPPAENVLEATKYRRVN